MSISSESLLHLSSVEHLSMERPQDLGKDEGEGRYFREQLAVLIRGRQGGCPTQGDPV